MSDPRPLRTWQLRALEVLRERLSKHERDMFVVAGVGAGKTRLGREAILTVLGREATQVIIVVPSKPLVKQWARDIQKAGISLLELSGNSKLENGLPFDVSGYVVTYASMATMPDLHAALSTSKPTIVVFDEIHHLGEEDHTEWGAKAKIAFSDAAFRLSLSGTPFRSSKMPIPFVRYRDDGQLDYDLSYSYGSAVADGYCRRVCFVPYDGIIEYTDGSHSYQNTFSDKIQQSLWSGRLQAANTPLNKSRKDNLLLRNMLHDANRRITDIRASGHENAGGILVANDIDHAKSLVRMLHRVSNEKPILVVSEDDRAKDLLKTFTDGESRWLVSVRMVSEGADIPRLRVGVYCSQITEELFFTQVMGRIVRMDPKAEFGESFFYIPADSRLTAIAKKIEDEMNVAIDLKRKEKKPGTDGIIPKEWELINADGDEIDSIVAGELFTSDERAEAEEYRIRHRAMFGNLSIAVVAMFIKDIRGREYKRKPRAEINEKTYTEEQSELRAEIHSKVGRLNFLTGRPHDVINNELNERVGLSRSIPKPRDRASLDQLRQMLALVNEMIVMANGDVAA